VKHGRLARAFAHSGRFRQEQKNMSAKQTLIKAVNVCGFPVFEPVVKLAFGDEPRIQLRKIWLYIGVPLLAFGLFLLVWTMAASSIVTKYGSVPTPGEVWHEAGNLYAAHVAAREEERKFYAELTEKSAKQVEEAAALREKAKSAETPGQKTALEKRAERLETMASKAGEKRYSGSPTYLDQIVTSLKTVFTGFFIASIFAVPIGILCGLSKTFMAAVTPMIQIFKPVSPLAWLPIVMIVVGALYTTDPSHAWFEKSFLTSAITVSLCSLWPTLINTALGVSSIDKDYLNVARVLKLGWFEKVRRIVIPASLPLIFTGLRLSLSVGWMVLIAAEMLAQNPGLGKFVWDMFQNGSSQTLAQIVVAVFTIGIVGFLLDRMMIILQKSVSFDTVVA
jgi:nitrate/nitrite transport system permease protein